MVVYSAQPGDPMATRLSAEASRGFWNQQGQWIPVPYLDLEAAEKLWAHKVLRLLQRKRLLSDDRTELLAPVPPQRILCRFDAQRLAFRLRWHRTNRAIPHAMPGFFGLHPL